MYVRFFKVATFKLDDSFVHPSLNQLHLVCFSNILKGIPTYVEHLFAAFP